LAAASHSVYSGQRPMILAERFRSGRHRRAGVIRHSGSQPLLRRCRSYYPEGWISGEAIRTLDGL
jgi:hypothetical protein